MLNKLTITITTLLFICFYASPQGGVSINNYGLPADQSAMLDINSINAGLLIPRMNTTQRNAISSPATGLLIFNLDCNEFDYNAGTPAAPAWIQVNHNPASIPSAPVANAGTGITTTGFAATWTNVQGALNYNITVAEDTNFTNIITGYNNLNTGTANSATITGLICGKKYYYHVAVSGYCGTSSFSNTVKVTTSSCPVIQISSCGNNITYSEVLNPSTGETWLDKNLGASQVATSSSDYMAYGSLYQWGRLSDGHQCITWSGPTSGTPDQSTTSSLSSVDVPSSPLFILMGGSSNWDWRYPQNFNLWQGTAGINNPCPSGYRIPTSSELDTERLSWTSQDISGAFNSSLKFPVAGMRNGQTGIMQDQTSTGYIWSNTISPYLTSYNLDFRSGSAFIGDNPHAHALAVRCIKD